LVVAFCDHQFKSGNYYKLYHKVGKEDIGQMVADLLHMNPRTLPSKIEVRPSIPK